VGRGEDLTKLRNLLQPSACTIRKVVVLYGLGGIGKTQLAIRFARLHQNDFSAIFWLNGKNQETLMHSLAEYLPKLPGINVIVNPKTEKEIEQAARQVLQWLAAPGNSKWLLIFDNIHKYSAAEIPDSDTYDIMRFFPSTDRGSIIITTRVTRLSELGSSYPVETLQSDEAVTLLINSAGQTVRNADNHCSGR
jgi:ATP/maltotriose-dependent transcriptional regulator MalT